MQTIYTKYLPSRKDRVRSNYPKTCETLDKIYARMVGMGLITMSFDDVEGDYAL